MRYVSRAALLFLFVLGACLAIGCSEKSTEPKDSPPPSTVMKHLWSERFGDASGQYAQGVAADASGNMIVTGIFNGAVDFGGGPLTSAGSDDIFVAKFGSNGAHVWSKRFGDSDPQNAYDVAVDVSGNVIVAGFFLGPVDFGGGPLTSAGGYDIFVAKFGPGGNHIWSRRFGNASDQFARSVAVDASGNVIVTGYFYGTVDFGCGVLTCAGLSDVFVAEFGPGGDCIWSKRFGDVGDQAGYAVAADASGNAIVAGYFNGTIDFGGGALTSAGDKDIFVAKFEPDGDHIRSERFGDASSQIALAVAVDVSGNVIVAGFFQGSVNFGGTVLTSAGGRGHLCSEVRVRRGSRLEQALRRRERSEPSGCNSRRLGKRHHHGIFHGHSQLWRRCDYGRKLRGHVPREVRAGRRSYLEQTIRRRERRGRASCRRRCLGERDRHGIFPRRRQLRRWRAYERRWV